MYTVFYSIYIYYIILKILLLYKYYWIVVDRPHKKAQGLTETFSSVPDLETSHALASTGWSRDKRSVSCSAALRRFAAAETQQVNVNSHEAPKSRGCDSQQHKPKSVT